MSKIPLVGLIMIMSYLSYNAMYFPTQYQAMAQANNTAAKTTRTAIPSQSTTTIGNFLTYQNPTYGIKILFPSDWTVSQTGLKDHTNIIAFFSPLENLSDAFSEHVLLSLNRYSQNITLNDYGKLVNNTINQPGVQIVESKPITLAGGYPAHTIVFTPRSQPPGGNALFKPEILLLWTVKGDNVYTISYNAEATRYSKYLPTVLKMVDSFQIIK
jgi:eukaryotic-like serine/threonine-protein kinase